MKDRAEELRTFATSAKKRGIRDVVLLGMGGSSLGPEVLRATFGSSRWFPRFWVLDSTVPGWVQQVTQAIDPARSLFILASKSGGTIEVMSLFAHFWERVHQTPGHQGGAQFLAITDPGTGLEKLAAEHQFWRIFTNPPDIGGRYSVLSYFGLVPAVPDGYRCHTITLACHGYGPGLSNPAPSRRKPRRRTWRNDGLAGASRAQQNHRDYITTDQHIWSVGGTTPRGKHRQGRNRPHPRGE